MGVNTRFVDPSTQKPTSRNLPYSKLTHAHKGACPRVSPGVFMMGKLETTSTSVNKGVINGIVIRPHNGYNVAIKTWCQALRGSGLQARTARLQTGRADLPCFWTHSTSRAAGGIFKGLFLGWYFKAFQLSLLLYTRIWVAFT